MRSLVLVVLLLGATTVTPLAADYPQIALSIRDHQFVPSDVPAPAGVKVELIIKNEQATTAEFESTALRRERSFLPAAKSASSSGRCAPEPTSFSTISIRLRAAA